ncbi:DUF559 domain-containing protein [Paenibacillus sp. NPDC058071]|uniref:DUF559 domain-containing protein n=1 Tax=Paenibacillus sp. NPDC058071 TaxID=3346326 RepID=UPI0036D93C2C
MSIMTNVEQWLAYHQRLRKGDARRKLEEGLGHAEKMFIEKVWIPAFKQLDHLHPEYEVADFKDGMRFLDFAYLNHTFKVAIEIDGYSTHASNVSRWQFSDSRMRQNHLVIDGWTVLRFAYDDVHEKPMSCIQLLQQYLGSRMIENSQLINVSHKEKVDRALEQEIIRLAVHLNRNLRPIDIIQHLSIGKKRTQVLIEKLVNAELLQPTGKGTQRTKSYQVNQQKLHNR